jgi:hypothetical protein
VVIRGSIVLNQLTTTFGNPLYNHRGSDAKASISWERTTGSGGGSWGWPPLPMKSVQSIKNKKVNPGLRFMRDFFEDFFFKEED